jgi:hypothetical protein
MPNQLPLSAYQVPNPDHMCTTESANGFARVLAKLGFIVNRLVVQCTANVSSPTQEVPIAEVPFADPVTCLVYIDGHVEKGGLNVAITDALYHRDGPSIYGFSALWAMLNPGKTQAEAQAALLNVPAISDAVKSALLAIG